MADRWYIDSQGIWDVENACYASPPEQYPDWPPQTELVAAANAAERLREALALVVENAPGFGIGLYKALNAARAALADQEEERRG